MLIKACQWDDVFLVGDLLVDGEHRRLIEMTCSFARLVDVGAISYREAMNLAREVMFHVTTHFQHEELLLELYNASSIDIELHKREHTKLKIILGAAVEDVREQEGLLFREACISLCNNLFEFITDHIATVDKETLRPCIAAHSKSHQFA